MFHIPFNKRSKISTQRFSIPGVPCLYLAVTSYGVWLELNKPKNDNFFVSSYKIQKNLKILNLCIQQHLINGYSSSIQSKQELDDFLVLMELFPLTIATSFTVKEKKEEEKKKF